MATIPTIESVLLEVLQALDLDELQSKTKAKFKKRQMSMKNHQQMVFEVFQDICRELELDVDAKEDVLFSLNEAYAFQLALENSIWTFGADRRQVLWYVLAYTWMPFFGRKIAFWQLDETMDADMPGGKFWYLPQGHQEGGRPQLRMPVVAVLDWLFDLSGISMNMMSSCLGGGYDEKSKVAVDTPAGIESNLYKWFEGVLPRSANISSVFRDGVSIPFEGAFTVDANLEITKKLEATKQFIERKGLSPDDLRHEIPMTSPGAIEQVLAGQTSDQVTAHFINLLEARYAIPSMQTIRKRLHVARAIQHGYRKLLKALCLDKVEETCADPSLNKVLQLFDIFKYVYNLTIDAHGKCSTRSEEDVWFESHIPPWYSADLFYSILPSSNVHMQKTAKLVGTILTKRYVEFQGVEDLEDLFGWDELSTKEIANRNLLLLKKDVDRIKECQRLSQSIRFGSPWRTLQGVNDYHVIRSLLENEAIPHRTRQLVLGRMEEVAISQDQKVGVILQKLDDNLNSRNKDRVKNCLEVVELLIGELESSPYADIIKAEIFQHKAKHYLFQSDFKSAETYFHQALEACEDRNRGTLRGQIARDLFGLSVATQPLIPNNHEKYYREASFAGFFEGSDPSKFSMEDAAVAVADYFWEDLYKPYLGIEVNIPPSQEQIEGLLDRFMSICESGDWEALDVWGKKNSHLKNMRFRDVRGDTFLSLFLKMTYDLRKKTASLKDNLPASFVEHQDCFEVLLQNQLQALKRLAVLWPKLLDMADFKAQTPLMIAANNGDIEMVETFLSAGADPNLQDFKGRTALFSAVAARSAGCVNLVLEGGVDIFLKTIDDNTVLHTAAKFGHPQIVEIITSIEPSMLEMKDIYGLTPAQHLDAILNDYNGYLKAMAKEGRTIGTIIEFQKIRRIISR